MTEIEIKIRLDSQKDFEKLRNSLGEPRIEYQINYYLDTNDGYFVKAKSTFRLRIVNNSEAFVTYKSKTKLEHGVAQSEEIEEKIPLDLVIPNINHEGLYRTSKIYQKILDLNKLLPLNMKVLGSISTIRRIYSWNQQLLELDDTDYGFDRNYEIEIEVNSNECLLVKSQLEDMLRNLGIKFADSKANKFTNFIKGKIH
jgi:uncharacterized protein YjbK